MTAAADRVAVTGVGLVGAGGIGTEANWAAVCAGVGLAERAPELAGGPVELVCRAVGFDGDALIGRRSARRMDRAAQMGVVAAREATAASGLTPGEVPADRLGVVMGTGGSGVTGVVDVHERLRTGRAATISPLTVPRSLPGACAAEIALDHGASGPNFATSAGCASGLVSIGVAVQMLRAGIVDVMLAGGADCLLHPVPLAAFAQMGVVSRRVDRPTAAVRPFDVERDGFVAAEGAGVLVLERAGHARARGARVLAWVAGYGAASDAHHFAAVHPEGRGGEQAARAALADAGWDAGDVDHVNAHGSATRAGDLAEARWLARVLPHRPSVTATKAVLGYAGAASGATEAALTVLSVARRRVPPTANHERPEPGLDLDVVTGAPRAGRTARALCVSTAPGGQNSVLAVADV
ncbi:beta-ketoacyl-[acyl-carrier-protein] synthase family protein [Streptomyces sp. NPDC087212]|uniref:beta-ketoacyl-[acyl-carrier-protein] synthase family protein n=1 Tax=Streptomyces sp. NPDC087212 TaxID=3365766 RepID=UPI0038234600